MKATSLLAVAGALFLSQLGWGQPAVAPETPQSDEPAPMGVLGAPFKSGRDSWFFSVLPEHDLKFGWQLRPHFRLNVGYSVLDWSTVQRLGNVLEGGLFSSDPWFGASQLRPTIVPRRTDSWIQGVNLGLEVQF